MTKGVTRYFKFLLLDFPLGKDLNLELGDIHKAFLQKVAFFFLVFLSQNRNETRRGFKQNKPEKEEMRVLMKLS